MAPLRGTLKGNRGEVGRLGTDVIHSQLETWHGSIRTVLEADGTFAVYVGTKRSPHTLLVEGNVDKGKRYASLNHDAQGAL